MKRETCFELDGAKIKEDLLEISFGKPDEEESVAQVEAKQCV